MKSKVAFSLALMQKRVFVFLLSVVLSSLMLIHTPVSEAGEGEDEVVREDERIKKFASNVKRDGITLYLRLKSGSYAILANLPGCTGWGSCREYEFVDYFEDVGFYHVSLDSGEISEFMMISDRDGENYWTYDYARLSPDRKRFVSVAQGNAYAPGGVFIGRFEQGRIVRELEHRMEGSVQYSFSAWEDNKTVMLSRHIGYGAETCPGSTSLKLDDEGWRFHEELSGDTVTCGPTSKD